MPMRRDTLASPLVGTQASENFGCERNPGGGCDRLDLERIALLLSWLHQSERLELAPFIELDRDEACDGTATVRDLQDLALFHPLQHTRGEVAQIP